MRGTRSVLLILASVIVASCVTLLSPSAAHASGLTTVKSMGSPFSGFDPRGCGGIEIHLTGKDTFNVHCLPKHPHAKDGQISPLTNESSNGGCSASDIIMHLNINYNDNVPGFADNLFPLCINGAGSISNFQNIIACEQNFGFCSNDCFLYNCISYPDNWNDIASSFTTGAWYGRIYVNANLSGNWAQFNPNEYCADMRNMGYSYTSGPINFNDVVSSIWVGGAYSEGTIVC